MSRGPSRTRMPRPFLKWAGGKSSLLNKIIPIVTKHKVTTYVEPFVGGGAVFFELARTGRFEQAILGDRNPELVLLWETVRDNVEGLIKAAVWKNTEAEYYRVRALTRLSPVRRAARTLWMNRHCYNGLYRLNSSGGFNVPYGFYKKPRIDADNLRACSVVLQNVEIVTDDFEALFARMPTGATVYCDPPYAPVSVTASFNRYDGQPFDEADQRRLADAFMNLRETTTTALLSNSKTPFTDSLYPEGDGLTHHPVMVRRNINRNAAGRGPVPELLVELE